MNATRVGLLVKEIAKTMVDNGDTISHQPYKEEGGSRSRQKMGKCHRSIKITEPQSTASSGVLRLSICFVAASTFSIQIGLYGLK